MTGVCNSVKIYEDMNFSLLGSARVPAGKRWLSKLDCRDAWGPHGGWDQGDGLPAHRWWALMGLCVASKVRKEVPWILFESPCRQSLKLTSVVWPEVMEHSTTRQCRGMHQGQQWGTETPSLA